MQLDGDVTSFLTLHCTPDTYHHRHHHHRRHHHRQFVIVIIIVVIVVLIIIVIFAVVVVVIVNSSPYSVEIIYWMKVLTPADSNNLCNIRTSLFICRLCIIYQNLLLAVYFLPLSHSRDLPSVSPITSTGCILIPNISEVVSLKSLIWFTTTSSWRPLLSTLSGPQQEYLLYDY